MRLLQRRALPAVALLAAATAAAPAAARISADPVALLHLPALHAPTAVARTCSARELPANAAGAVVRRVVVPATGWLDARLTGSTRGPDWDLAVFDVASGRQVGASDGFGATELVQAPVTAGQLLEVQACRYGGGTASVVPLSVRDIVISGALPKTAKLSLVSIPFRTVAQVDRLARAGIDLNESARGHSIDAVLHGPADALKLRRFGMRFHVKVPDLVAYDRRSLAVDQAAADAGTASGLPSGRTTYRHLVDYENDLKALATQHPDTVRGVVIGTSVQGRPIEGVEIAHDVNATDDGRPTHVEMGLHHAREWQSGEVPMEFAIDLVQHDGTDARMTKLLDEERTFDFPVINPDAFEETMFAGDYNAVTDDGSGLFTLGPEVADLGAYRRKNCEDVSHTGSADPLPCELMVGGVDLNRNYGAFWGGPGEDDDPTAQDYRGPAPYSEPETQAVHTWSSHHQVMLLNSNHSYAADVLYQPGFSRKDEPGLPMGTKVPHQDQMKAVSDAMAKAEGYVSEVSYDLYDVTGATEDWNYFSQNTFGYTTELGYDDFHVDYQDSVVDQYLGTENGPLDAAASPKRPVSKGAREAMIIAGEAAANPAYHSIIEGTAPAGATLKLTKDFTTSTSNVESQTETLDTVGDPMQIPEHLETTLTVPSDGHYVWHVNPSTRPVVALAHKTEAWTLTCGTESHQIVVDMGQAVTQDLHC